MKRYLLCRALGGFNDQLNQINFCRKYAEKWDRHLIIDTRVTGLNRNFFSVFEQVKEAEIPISDASDFPDDFYNSMEVYPNCLKGAFFNFEHEVLRILIEGRTINLPVVTVDGVTESLRISAKTDGTLFPIDNLPDFEEELVVHQSFGGGPEGVDALSFFRLRKDLADHIIGRLCALPQNLVSVHVRSTDMRGDFETFFKTLDQHIADEVLLICSDNRSVVESAKESFTSNKVMSVSDVPDIKGRALHYRKDYIGSDASMRDLFLDLLALASAPQLCMPIVHYKSEKPMLSGFSILADVLRTLPELQMQLLSAADQNLLEQFSSHGPLAVPRSTEIMDKLALKDARYEKLLRYRKYACR
ncbi:MAG: hypothetical protein AAFR98_02975 [Pseudomonadota bacterium]